MNWHLVFFAASVVLLAVLQWLGAPLAQACAACQCGDPSLVSLGSEKGFTGRSRLALSDSYREEWVREGSADARHTQEHRRQLSLAYWWHEDWALGISLPWVRKTLEEAQGLQEAEGLADLEWDLRYTAFTAGAWRLGVYGGGRLDSAREAAVQGQVLDFDAQPGQGADLGKFGLWQQYQDYPWSMRTSILYLWPLNRDLEGFHMGEQWQLSAQALHTLRYRWSVGVGLDAKIAEADTFGGVPDENTGGRVLYTRALAVYRPVTALSLQLQWQAPSYQRLRGEHRESSVLSAAAAWDF